MTRLFTIVVLSLACSAAAQTGAKRNQAKDRRPNAMKIYTLGWNEFIETLGDGFAEFTTVAAGIPPWDAPLTCDEYTRAVAVSRSPRDLFTKASATKRCELADPGGAFPDDEGCVGVMHLAMLVAAHGRILGEEKPELAVTDAISLLRCSRQLRTIEHRDGHSFAPSIEALGMRLMADVLEDLPDHKRHADDLERCAAELKRHDTLRPSFATYPDSVMRVANLKWFKIPKGTAGNAVRARREKAVAIVNEFLAPLKDKKLPTVADARAHDRRHSARVSKELDVDYDSASEEDQLRFDAWAEVEVLDLGLAWPIECELGYQKWRNLAHERLAERLR